MTNRGTSSSAQTLKKMPGAPAQAVGAAGTPEAAPGWASKWTPALRDFWDARSSREQRMLGWGGALAGLALAYSVLWSPAQSGCARLERTLPDLRRALAQMNAQAAEARTLAVAAHSAAPTGPALRDALVASLGQHGFADAHTQLVGGGVQIQLKNASFPAWVQWLDDVRRQFRVQVSEAHVSALKTDGQVDLSALMQPAGSTGDSGGERP